MARPRFDFEDYMSRVAHRKWLHPQLRYGQCLFSVLEDMWPDKADEIRGSRVDPFYETTFDRFFAEILGEKPPIPTLSKGGLKRSMEELTTWKTTDG